MNQFDVYAIGNALLDIEYHSSPARLVELGIDKGVMTLIDEQRQNSLVAQLGESHEKMTCGGSAANTIIALAQMGAHTHLDCRVASDMAGQVFMRDLHDSKVHSNLDSGEEVVGVTGKCLVFVTPDADRTMNTFLGASAELELEDVSEEAIRHSKYVYIEGYLASADNTRDAAIEARKIAERHGVRTALTLSDPNMLRFFRESIDAMIGNGVDLLFANEEEILDFAGTDSLEQALDAVHKVARHFAITRGAAGALVYDGISLIEIAPHAVDAVDTLGAGDMFAGAFLYGLTQDMSYTQAGDLASAASAEIVTRFGPRLAAADTRAVLQRFKAGI
ncbi:MAG: adenosine kinase [Gammaproteobacteria bacterium]|nr:adenosine kinase [Gammaproteobacteria bacterium]